MPETQLNRVLRAAIGWFELGMAREALAELDTLIPQDQVRTETLELRAVLLQQLEQWEQAAQTYCTLCSRPGAPVERFIAWGCCLYELNRVKQCREVLLAAPDEARQNGLWCFHLACYESILGNKEVARRWAQESLRLDPQLKRMVAQNENISPLFG